MRDQLVDEIVNMRVGFVSKVADNATSIIGIRKADELASRMDEVADHILDGFDDDDLGYSEILYSMSYLCLYLFTHIKLEIDKLKLAVDIAEWGVNDE